MTIKGDQKNLFTKYIFFKVVVSNIRDAFSFANHFIQQINIISTFDNIKKKIFCHILI